MFSFYTAFSAYSEATVLLLTTVLSADVCDIFGGVNLRRALRFLSSDADWVTHMLPLCSTEHHVLQCHRLLGRSAAQGVKMCQAMLQNCHLPVVQLTGPFKVVEPPAETHLWGDYKWDLHVVYAGPMSTLSAESPLPSPSGACQVVRPISGL